MHRPNQNTKTFLIALLLAIATLSSLPAQQTPPLEWQYFGPEQGMGMGFLDILQDHQGFIWLGSTNGLYRYDGYEIRPFKKYTNRPTGPLSDFIWDLEEGPDGDIWLGTYDGGLNRWDRSTQDFHHYTHQPDNPTSLSSNHILKVLVDTVGDVWAVAKLPNGVPVLDKWVKATGEVTHYRFDPSDERSLSCDTISITTFSGRGFHPLYLDPAGEVWIATANGLNLYDRSIDGFRRFRSFPGDPSSLSFPRVLSVEASEEEAGAYWVRTASADMREIALDRLEIAGGRVQRMAGTGEKEPVVGFLGYHFSAATGELWGVDETLRAYDMRDGERQTREILLQEPGNHYRFELFRHSGGRFLLPMLDVDPLEVIRGGDQTHSGSALGIYDPATGQHTRIDRNPVDPSLPLRGITAIMEDRSGILWLGDVGFYKLRLPDSEKRYVPVFENYPEAKEHGDGLASTDIRDVYQASPQVFWLATHEGGLIRLDRQTGDIRHFRHDPARAGSLRSDFLYALWYDAEGRQLWIGHERGIDLLSMEPNGMNPASPPRFRPLIDSLGRLGDRVNTLRPAGEDLLWIGTTNNGLLLYDLEKGRVEDRVFFEEPNPDPAHTAFINEVFVDSGGQTWVAPGMGGLCRLDRADGGFEYECFLDGMFIVDLLERSDSSFWCAAMNYGIIDFDPRSGDYELINMENRLQRNSVMGLEKDGLGRIWFTSIGLTRYDPEEDTYKSYGREAGVIGLDPERCFFKSRSGELFYSAPHGALQIFNPDRVTDNPVTPRVVLTDFKLFNESVPVQSGGPLAESIEVTSEIHLAHDQHSFAFAFAGLEYSNPERNQYRYRLEGVDRNWVYAGANREARYNSVRPGHYVFRVEAANSDGVWSEEAAVVRIFVAKPWWRTWWAYLLFAVLVAAPVLVIYRYEVRRKIALAEARRLQELDELRTRLYTNITHEFRTPLTVILGMVEQIAREPQKRLREGLEMIARGGKQLLRLVNQLLDLRKIDAGAMQVNKRRGEVLHFIKYLVESVHSMAEARRVRLGFVSTVEHLEMDYDEDSLVKILSNLLTNAIKFTPPEGEVLVEVAFEKEMLEIRVKDSGPGIPPDQQERIFDRFYQVDDSATRKGEGVGVGLALTRELVRLLDGEISVRSPAPGMRGRGSVFRVELPVTREAPPREESRMDAPDESLFPFLPPPSEPPVLEEETPAARGEERPLALIIEDNSDVVRYLNVCLEGDYRLIAAGNGADGVEMAFEEVPDVIISDVMMPEKDGFTVTEMLKKDVRTSHIPIILLTAKADESSRLEGLTAGADAYLTKPFNRAELMVRMKKAIELRERLQTHYAEGGAGAESEDPAIRREDAFVDKVQVVVKSRLSDPGLSVEALAREVFLSPAQLHRKLKALTGKPPGQFIRDIRLQHGWTLLRTTDKPVAEIALSVGFRDAAYFSRKFTEKYSKPPTEVRDSA